MNTLQTTKNTLTWVCLFYCLPACGGQQHIVLQISDAQALPSAVSVATALNSAFGYEAIKIGEDEDGYRRIDVIVDSDLVASQPSAKSTAASGAHVNGMYLADRAAILASSFTKCARTREELGLDKVPCHVIGSGEPINDELFFQTVLIHEIGHALGVSHRDGTVMEAVSRHLWSLQEAAHSLREVYQGDYEQCPESHE